MSRRTRLQYLDHLTVIHKPRHTLHEGLEMLKRQIKRMAIKDGLIENPKDNAGSEWHWIVCDEYELSGWVPGGIVRANTRGEARALIKKELGVKRLPSNLNIEKVDPHANS